MGVDFKINNSDEYHAQWSYSGFGDFRSRVAHDIGIVLHDMKGYGGSVDWTTKMKRHPLYAFLMHSDCDGIWTYTQCKRIAPALKEIISKWNDQNRYYDHDIIEGENLILMMEHVKNDSEFIEFH